MLSDQLSRFLDFSRWVAALLVVINHLNNRMVGPLSAIPPNERSWLHLGWGFLSGFGHPAVVVFFVLSGYLVGGKILKIIHEGGDFRFSDYLIDRTTRIYLVLLPVIAAVWLMDTLGMTIDSKGIYQTHYSIDQNRTWFALFGTVLSVQNIFTPFYGTNGPLGTLANEFWYYLSFPLILMPCLRKGWSFQATILFLLGMGITIVWTLRSPWHGAGFIVWIIGAVASSYRTSSFRALVIPGLLFIVALLSIRLLFRGDAFTRLGVFAYGLDLVLAALFAWLLIAFRNRSDPATGVLANPVHKSLSDFSYSLYALHASLMTLICIVLDRYIGFGWASYPTVWWHWCILFLVLFFVVAVCWLFAKVTEDFTGTVRRAIKRRLRSSQIH